MYRYSCCTVNLNSPLMQNSGWADVGQSVTLRLPEGGYLGDYSLGMTPGYGYPVRASSSLGGMAFNDLRVTDPAPVINSIVPSILDASTTVPVEITGTGFGTYGSASRVDIQGICGPCAVNSWSSTRIVVTVPVPSSAAGSYTLTVTSGGFSGNGFQQVPKPAPQQSTQASKPIYVNGVPVQFTLNSFSWYTSAGYYRDNSDWTQDSVSSEGTTLVQNPVWNSQTSEPAVFYPGQSEFPTISNLSLTASGNFSRPIKLRIVPGSGAPTWLQFNGSIDLSFSNGSASYQYAISSSAKPTSIDNLRNVSLLWQISADGGSSWTTIRTTTHTIFVTAGLPLMIGEGTCSPTPCETWPGSRPTAARLNLVTTRLKGKDSTLLNEVLTTVRAVFVAGSNSLFDPPYNRDLWGLIANPSALGFDCSTLALAAAFELLTIGRDSRFGLAYPTYDWNATGPKIGSYGQGSYLLWFPQPGVRSSGQAYEGFVFDVQTGNSYTLFPQAGPYPPEIFNATEQGGQDELTRAHLKVMFETLKPGLWAGQRPDQRWVIGDSFVSGPISFPVPIP